ncbi:hypothetical protein niasHT_011455 [Heterodera trifolii]|uniref:Uncharacterized protein n=1 Tax=Heterodera trifolii TaxID=157864 RepID=A0ABD2L106_9BILA
MGVAREFGPWALNAREFRRAGLNPRVWLARRVNQSATDAVGGAVIFSVNVADPSPLDAAALSPGGADPLSSTDPLFSLSRGPLRRRGPPLPTAPRAPPHHSAVSRRGPPLFHGPPLSTAADPPPSFRRRGGADPSLLRTLPTIPSSSARTPSLRRRGPPLSGGADRTPSLRRRGPPLSIGADPLSSTDPLFPLSRGPLRRRGPPLPTAPRAPPHHSAVRAARTPSLRRRGPPLSVDADPLSPSARTPSHRRRLTASKD